MQVKRSPITTGLRHVVPNQMLPVIESRKRQPEQAERWFHKLLNTQSTIIDSIIVAELKVYPVVNNLSTSRLRARGIKRSGRLQIERRPGRMASRW